jgi:hypothetical protein
MLDFVEAQQPRIAEAGPGVFQRWSAVLKARGRRVFTRRRLRTVLSIMLVGLGLYAVMDMALLAFLAVAPSSSSAEFLRSLVSPGELAALGDKIWFSIRAVIEGSVGVTMLAGGVLIGLRREWRGVAIAVAGLICGLTVVNLLVFYEDQVKALLVTGLEYVLLVTAYFYRRMYLEPEAEGADGPDSGLGSAETFADLLREPPVEPTALPGEAS